MSLLHLRVCALQVLVCILRLPHAATPRPLQLRPLECLASWARVRVGRIGPVLGRVRVAVLPDNLGSFVARSLVQLLLGPQIQLPHGSAHLARLSRRAFGRGCRLSTARRLHERLACSLDGLVQAGIRGAPAVQLPCRVELQFRLLRSLQRGNGRYVLNARVLSIRPSLEVCRRRTRASRASRAGGAKVLEIALCNNISLHTHTHTNRRLTYSSAAAYNTLPGLASLHLL